MSAESFLDTNILVYAAASDPAEAFKREASLALIERTEFALSAQVLQEFYVTVTRKLERPLTCEQALEWIEQFEAFPCMPVDAALVKIAAEISQRYRISYWDGAVIAAARRAGNRRKPISGRPLPWGRPDAARAVTGQWRQYEGISRPEWLRKGKIRRNPRPWRFQPGSNVGQTRLWILVEFSEKGGYTSYMPSKAQSAAELSRRPNIISMRRLSSTGVAACRWSPFKNLET